MHPIVPDAGTLTVYLAPWCPFCRLLLSECEAAGVSVRSVDVDQDDAAAEWVRGVNGGNRVVPTVVYGDGSVETNPVPSVATQRA